MVDTRRMDWIDSLRVIVIVLVVLGNIFGMAMP